MRVRVLLIPGRKEQTLELPPDTTGQDLLKRLDLPVDAHLLVRADVPIPEDERLRDGDALTVIQVASGG